MSTLSNPSFNNFYIEALPLIQANARLVYGYHRTYDIAVTTKIDDITERKVSVAILMACDPHNPGGKVLQISESRAEGGTDAGHTSAMERIGNDLKKTIGDKMDELKSGTMVTEFES